MSAESDVAARWPVEPATAPPGEYPRPLVVIGIGADGLDSISSQAREEIMEAEVIVGSWRQLGLLPVSVSAEKKPWPTPLLPALDGIIDELSDRRAVILASGDPMFHGIGATLCRRLGAHRVRILPYVSSAQLACARLGWPSDSTPVVSLVNQPTETIIPALDSGRPFLVLCRDATTPRRVCDLLRSEHLAQARCWLLSDIGGVDEAIQDFSPLQPPRVDSTLNVVAIDPGVPRRSLLPGLPDDLYATQAGQLTKQHVRALAVCSLAPRDGQLLWDVGSGSGSIAIEFCRAAPRTRAVCFETHPERADLIQANATRLGVVALYLTGPAPCDVSALDKGVRRPDAVFIGGGLTTPGLVDWAWQALRPGGVMVAHAVTHESFAQLLTHKQQLGGTLTTISIAHDRAVGRFTVADPALPVHQWVVTKPPKPVGTDADTTLENK